MICLIQFQLLSEKCCTCMYHSVSNLTSQGLKGMASLGYLFLEYQDRPCQELWAVCASRADSVLINPVLHLNATKFGCWLASYLCDKSLGL